MAEYFKFCPKCGRVLDRDFCPHCEPEKEKAYRRQQQKQEKGMFEDYSRDVKWKEMFSGNKEKKKKVKFPSKTVTKAKKWQESGSIYSSKKKKTGGIKKGLVSKLVILAIILSFLSTFAGLVVDFIDEIELPGFIEKKIPNSIKSDDNTITDSYFSDMAYDDSVEDCEYQIRYDSMGDNDGHSRIEYKVGDEEYRYSISRPIISDQDGYGVDGPAQDAMDKVCQKWYEEGMNAKKDKVKVNAYLSSYTTYLDDDYACIVLNGSRYYDDETRDAEYTLDSFIIDLSSMEVIDPNDIIEFDDDVYDTILDQMEELGRVEDVSRELLESAKESGNCQLAFDREGDLWICSILDIHYQRNINVKYPGMFIGDL